MNDSLGMHVLNGINNLFEIEQRNIFREISALPDSTKQFTATEQLKNEIMKLPVANCFDEFNDILVILTLP